jgi:hypothetical protein
LEHTGAEAVNHVRTDCRLPIADRFARNDSVEKPMDHDEALSRVLPELSQRMRAAFAGACAERARALYESVADDDPEWFFDALGLVWDFAEGKDPDPTAVAAVEARVRRMYDDMMEAEESGHEADSLRSLLGALGSIEDPTIESAEEAAQFAIDAAGGTSIDDDHIARAQEEEEKFQLTVLGIVKSWKKPAIQLTEFEPVGWTEDEGWPEASWLTQFEENERW